MTASRRCRCLRPWTLLGLFVVMVAASGCAVVTGSAFQEPRPPQHVMIEQVEQTPGQPDPSTGVSQRVSLRVKQRKAGPPPRDYVVGPSDVLYINVFNQPAMGSPSTNDTVVGSRVDGDGNIQLPMVKTVGVAGMTVSQIQDLLQERFREYIAEPWVVVEVVQHRSQPIYLIGEFNQSGVVYMDRPTNVVQAIALGRGLAGSAYLRGARLIQDEQVVPVDIYQLLREGALDQNVWLTPGDTIYVPDQQNLNVFVFGEVENPGMVPMPQGELTLPQAIAGAGGFGRTGTSAEQVRIIRSLTPTHGELIVVDLVKTLRGEAMPFVLQPGDVVYIPRSRLGEWNDMLKELLPTLETVGAMLQPFVQLLVLSDRS